MRVTAAGMSIASVGGVSTTVPSAWITRAYAISTCCELPAYAMFSTLYRFTPVSDCSRAASVRSLHPVPSAATSTTVSERSITSGSSAYATGPTTVAG